MTLEEANTKIMDLETRLKLFEDVFRGVKNDIQIQDKVRKMVVIGEHTSGKPKIKNGNGKTYNLDTV